jgi:hypothetical protein
MLAHVVATSVAEFLTEKDRGVAELRAA